MAVSWWLATTLFLLTWNLETTLADGGAFCDFNRVPTGGGNRARDGYQYISPNLTFPCDGAVAKWKIGTEDQNNEQLYLQIWRPTGTDYTRVAETVYTHSGGGTIAEVLTNMTVSAGDVIGFFIPRPDDDGLRVAWTPVPDHTLLRGMMRSTNSESPVATFSGSRRTLSSSPLVSVIFVPDVTSSSILSMTIAASPSPMTSLAATLPPANGGDVPTGSQPGTVIGAVVAVVIVLVVGSVMLAALLIAWRLRSRGKKGFTDVTMQANPSYTAEEEGVTLEPNPGYSAVQATSTYQPITGHGEVSMGYRSRDGYGTAAVLVGMSSAEDESVVKRSTYANIDDVTPALYEVPVQNTTQYEVVIEHTTSAETNDAGHGCYEVPVSENDRQYEMVVEHRTQNGNAVYEGVGLGSSSAASSLFYQYVPSKRSRQQGVRQGDSLEHSAIHSELESVYGSTYTESANEEVPFTDPAEDVEDIYDQLAHEKCIEIPRIVLKAGTALGSGEFGEVFKGTWETPYGPQEVAIKMLKKGSTDKSKTTFLQEAAIMAQFRHPHIVRLLGAVTVDEPMVIVLEYLHKGDLRHFLLSLTPDPGTIVDEGLPKQLLTFCQEIAEGMRYLSRRGFVHRDLAARNILLSKELSCKIADFGMSKKLDETEYYVTSGGKVPVKWTAPEAIFHKKYSVNSDVWSYGMLMYEIWSLGKKPFSRLSPTELIHILQAETGYIQSPPPGCPKAIYKGMVQCWNLDHHSRPSFSELCSYLKDHSDRGGPSLLEVPLEAVRDPARAAQLGAPLSWAQDLYMDLQQYYL